LASIWFARHYPDAQIVAVELQPDNYAMLVRNTEEYPNITTLHAAVWNESGRRMTVDDPGIGNWGFRASSSSGPGPTVEAVTVPEIMDRFGMERVDLLKLDIEGAERVVLDAADAWIDKVDAVVAELHDRMTPGCSRTFFRVLAGFTEERWQGENVLVERPHTSPTDSLTPSTPRGGVALTRPGDHVA
jgi:FkbM family methyltransferase